ncbi:type IV pilin-like G/H family protein [Nostoc sp. C117]|uniref:type IV pilin-like G/H family protein n=1 Tax=Nostoc sp. C117 TaxID=3349875 RepID=UPI00370DA176
MPAILPHFGKFQIASKMLTSSVFVALLMTVDTTVLAQPSIAPTQIQSQPAPDTNPIAQKLFGQWETKDPSSSTSLTFIFTPENKLFLLIPDSKDTGAIEFKYRINPTPQPMHLDVIISSNEEPVLTIFEFTANSQMRLQLDGTNPGKPRPTAFSSQASLFKKVSNGTTLPDNIQIINPEAENQQTNDPKVEAKKVIASINLAQQAYYLQNQKFGTLEQLNLGIKPETENYHYRIVPSFQQAQIVISTAAAKKPQLKSYTGIVFNRTVKGQAMAITGICETDEPSNKPPLRPIFSNQKSQQIQCPVGSHLL